MQDKAEKVLDEIGQTTGRRGRDGDRPGPATNEILAMANWPRVDANELGGAPGSARRTAPSAYTYEPGSTFKAFTVAGALQERAVTP